MQSKLIVTPAPHITRNYTTLTLMFAMAIALIPQIVSGVFNLGVRALYVVIIAVGSAYVFDLLLKLCKKEKIDWADISSIVTGMMIGCVLPVSVPLYIPIIASFLAVVVFKGCFGGVGKNIFNPTAAARVVLGLVFAGLTLEWFKGTSVVLGENVASPIEYLAKGDYSIITLRSLFFGTAPGAIGTVSMLCILISGIVLMCFGITNFVLPVCSILTYVIVIWISKGSVAVLPYLFSGSFMFASMFMLTDPTTSPNTLWGKLVFALIFGVIAGLFRCFNVLGETSVFVALLIVNVLSPLLDKIFAPRPLGLKRRVK